MYPESRILDFKFHKFISPFVNELEFIWIQLLIFIDHESHINGLKKSFSLLNSL